MTKSMMAILAAATLAAPDARAYELDLGVGVGVAAPISEVLRQTGPGLAATGQATWGVLPYLDVGLRYSLATFFQDTVDASGAENEPIIDHGASAVVSLTFLSGSDNGWLDAPGGMAGDLWLDLGLGYHLIGRESVFGLDAGLGYTFSPGANCFVGPFFRVAADFETSRGQAVYLTAGLTFGYDLGWLIEGGDEEEDDFYDVEEDDPLGSDSFDFGAPGGDAEDDVILDDGGDDLDLSFGDDGGDSTQYSFDDDPLEGIGLPVPGSMDVPNEKVAVWRSAGF